MTDNSEPVSYRVTMPMVQIVGHVPFTGKHQVLDRHLRLGDVVPSWVPADEVERLVEGGFIERVGR